jgi:hypothetical protein
MAKVGVEYIKHLITFYWSVLARVPKTNEKLNICF